MEDEPTATDPVLLLRIPEAARPLGIGIGRTKAYELIADGRHEVVRIDSAVRVPAAAVERFVDKRLHAADVRGDRYDGEVAGGRPIRRFR